MRTVILDRCLMGVALAGALASLCWFGTRELRPTRHRRDSDRQAKSAGPYQPVAIDSSPHELREWRAPSAQARGPGWVYDVFTPPEIRYDQTTRQFAVSPPEETPGADPRMTSPGVVLVAVNRQPYRLQLVGYVGGEGNYLGTFENVDTSEIFLGGAGRRFPALDLEIADFGVRRRAFPPSLGISGNHWVATAVVHDVRTGVDTALTAGERAYTDELRAIFADDPEEAESYVELRRGEEFARAERNYRVERLQVEPPLAEIVEVSAASAEPARWSLSADADEQSVPYTADQPPPRHDN